MHILVLSNGYPSPFYPLDGIFARDQAEALADYGHKVGLISINPVSIRHIIRKRALPSFGFKKFQRKGVDTWLKQYINLPRTPLYSISQTLKKGMGGADDYIRVNGVPDIIHVHCFEAVLLANYFKKKFNIPFVITEHSSRFLFDTLPASLVKFAAMAFSISSRNIAVSSALSKKLSDKFSRHFTYIPNVVDTKFFTPGKKNGMREFTYVNVAAIDANKNQLMLIDSFAQVLETKPQSRLIIVGNGPDRRMVEEKIFGLGISKKVTLMGSVNRSEVKTYINLSDVLVLSSRTETFGVVLIEAMSCGVPCISTMSGGPSDIITDARLGVLCENNRVSLSNAMIEVQDNYPKYDSVFICKHATDNYSNFAIAKKLTDTYKKVLFS